MYMYIIQIVIFGSTEDGQCKMATLIQIINDSDSRSWIIDVLYWLSLNYKITQNNPYQNLSSTYSKPNLKFNTNFIELKDSIQIIEIK